MQEMKRQKMGKKVFENMMLIVDTFYSTIKIKHPQFPYLVHTIRIFHVSREFRVTFV